MQCRTIPGYGSMTFILNDRLDHEPLSAAKAIPTLSGFQYSVVRQMEKRVFGVPWYISLTLKEIDKRKSCVLFGTQMNVLSDRPRGKH